MAYTLEQTPTWAVAAVCTVIVFVSVLVERLIHSLGHRLKEKKQKPLFEALEKMKEELMVMGFISLFLVVFQASIISLCMPESWSDFMLPCPYDKNARATGDGYGIPGRRKLLAAAVAQVENLITIGGRKLLDPEHTRRLAATAGKCPTGKVHIISLEGLHQLHIFIFVMTCVHVVYSCITIFLGFYRMHGWATWEEETRADNYDQVAALRNGFKLKRTKTYVASKDQHALSCASLLSWCVSFFRQFGSAVVKEEYLALRLGFIVTHNLTNKFDFHSYIKRTLEDDFKVIVGINSSLWAFVVIFLLLNVHNWYTYFWIAFLPLFMILLVGTKLQHIIQQLSLETAQSQGVIGVKIVEARDSLFWFNRPQILLSLIHFILFQNAFELAFFLWILFTFGFDSCVMGKAWPVITRLVMGTAVQILCSYSTLPLYALVTQMGSHYKKGIFQEKTASAIIGWRHKAKKNLQKKAQEGEDEGAGQIMSLRSQAAESMERDVPRDSVSSTTGNAWDLESRPLRREALDSATDETRHPHK
ncbi:hypothetical protein KC19_1G144900 [Ceratodon purpureus]|uniref:MLO-like protein n=1 Tax=Ceratodon purpureus TaxID=3225 RepID=A0A8T0J749_CERPU|nr:hypothetical protein KC19_1G144900 [Ceratodon purpureus]